MGAIGMGEIPKSAFNRETVAFNLVFLAKPLPKAILIFREIQNHATVAQTTSVNLCQNTLNLPGSLKIPHPQSCLLDLR